VAVTLQQVYDFWQGRGTLPEHPVVLSFDDGNQTDFSIVAPLLHSLHWPGVLNLIVGRKLPLTFARMAVPDVRALVAAGWEIDSHTVDHADLTKLSGSALAFQLTESRTELRRVLGVPANFFCYPSGRYDTQTVAAVRAAGYLGATTTSPGYARPTSMFTLHRIRVSGGESIASFADLGWFRDL
jgi:peptidoglycan/xylan/chitin deacetylase (PgdA/CDA1 family)